MESDPISRAGPSGDDDRPQKLALVTGTSRGIGEAIAHALLDRHWTVLGLARSDSPAQLREHPLYTHLRLDLADLEAVEQTFEHRLPELVSFDAFSRFALVNNAGLLGTMAPLDRLPAASLLHTLTVNLVAPAWLMGFALRRLPRRALRIVDLSSGAAEHPTPGWASYCLSKVGLHMLGRVLACEVDEVESMQHPDLGILSFAPNVIATAMQEQLREADASSFPRRQRFVDLHEQGRLSAAAGPAAVVAQYVDTDRVPRRLEHRYDPSKSTPSFQAGDRSSC